MPTKEITTLGWTQMFGPFIDQYFELQEKMEERKEEIKAEWQKIYSMPRKMKKRRRKELLIDWAIANWEF
jgi:hypothetical protein